MRNRMIAVKVSDIQLSEMITERLYWWREQFDKALIRLLEIHFEEAIDNGYYDGAELDVNSWVDNALVNDFDVKFDEVDDRQVAQLINCASGEIVREIEWETEEA